MNMKKIKYEILKKDSIMWKGKTLYLIKALKNFSDVKKGDLGGYIESESNLSQEGNCWIYDEGKVFDNAFVSGNATIRHNAQVYEYAHVYDNAIIGDFAEIRDHSKVYESAIVRDHDYLLGESSIYGHAWVYGCSVIRNNVKIYGVAHINAWIEGNVEIFEGYIMGRVNLSYKNIFQHLCKKGDIFTALLTDNGNILYFVEKQENVNKETLLDFINNKDGGLKKNPHRKEYLVLIPLIEEYFKEMKEEEN